MNPQYQPTDYRINQTNDYICIDLLQYRQVLSSAVANGGLVRTRYLINCHVDTAGESKHPPEHYIALQCQIASIPINAVGMMTAASMNSFRLVRTQHQDTFVDALVTTGLDNARCAGDPAEYRHIGDAPTQQGTINIFLITNANLSAAAMTEAIMIVTESKPTVFNQLGIISKISAMTATGTGTDSVAIVNGIGRPVAYCGKHVLMGEMIAKSVKEALNKSIQKVI